MSTGREEGGEFEAARDIDIYEAWSQHFVDVGFMSPKHSIPLELFLIGNTGACKTGTQPELISM